MHIPLGSQRIELEQIGSTNSWLSDHIQRERQAGNSVAEGLTVTTAHQTDGRGQRGNQWLSEPGANLTFSVLLHPRQLPASKAFVLNKLVALSVLEALDGIMPPDITLHLKWPNDLVAMGRKFCGMLIENQISAGMVETSIVGIGLNVNQQHFGKEYTGKVTSLSRLTGRQWPLEPVLKAILEHMDLRYRRLTQGHSQTLPELDRAYLQRMWRYQEWASYETDAGRLEAMIVGVNPEGKLALQQNDRVHYYDLKEVRFV